MLYCSCFYISTDLSQIRFLHFSLSSIKYKRGTWPRDLSNQPEFRTNPIRARSAGADRTAIGVHTGKGSRRKFLFSSIAEPAELTIVFVISNAVSSLFHKRKLLIAIRFDVISIPFIGPAQISPRVGIDKPVILCLRTAGNILYSSVSIHFFRSD